MKRERFLFLFAPLMLFSLLHASEENLESLLVEYARKADLSQQTKKESAGFLQVYTRQDLDSMQIKQLKEILEKIPFFRYQENNYGLPDPFYAPYQPSPSNGIKIYINDRAVTSAYTDNGLKFLGQMNLSFVDHIEVYLGIPSQTFGIEGAGYVVKLYTKHPDREETSLAGAFLGSRGTQGYYAYDARDDGGFKHFLYADYMNLQRQNVVTQGGNTLERNKEYVNGYGELHIGRHRFEAQVLQGRADAFMGDSPAMTSIDPSIDFRYGYAGWYYEETTTGWKAFVNYTRSVTKYHDRSSPYPLGAIVLSNMVLPYYSETSEIVEEFSDTQVKKRFHVESFESENGLQARYKHFTIPNRKLDGQRIDMPDDYDTEIIVSAFSENSYMFDESHMLVASLKVDRYFENGDIPDRTLYSGRLGYIYNGDLWTSKTFLMYTDALPAMSTFYDNRYVWNQNESPDVEHAYVAATKLIRKRHDGNYALMAVHLVRDKAVYFDFESETGPRYDNMEDPFTFDSLLFEYEKRFDPLNVFKCNAWEVYSKYRNGMGSGRTWGAMASLTNEFGRFTLHNDLVYKYYRSAGGPGLDWNMALTWRPTRALTLYIKANNILGRALKENYYTYLPASLDPLNQSRIIPLDGVDVFDKRVWAGVEFQF